MRDFYSNYLVEKKNISIPILKKDENVLTPRNITPILIASLIFFFLIHPDSDYEPIIKTIR